MRHSSIKIGPLASYFTRVLHICKTTVLQPRGGGLHIQLSTSMELTTRRNQQIGAYKQQDDQQPLLHRVHLSLEAANQLASYPGRVWVRGYESV